MDYTPDEVATWEAVWHKVFDLLPGRACSTHRRVLDQMIKECGFRPNNIPQMEDVSNYLKSNSFFHIILNIIILLFLGTYLFNFIYNLPKYIFLILGTSGFSLRPAAGLVTARDFLASLAFRVFQCTQYIRHSSRPHHSPEP